MHEFKFLVIVNERGILYRSSALCFRGSLNVFGGERQNKVDDPNLVTPLGPPYFTIFPHKICHVKSSQLLIKTKIGPITSCF